MGMDGLSTVGEGESEDGRVTDVVVWMSAVTMLVREDVMLHCAASDREVNCFPNHCRLNMTAGILAFSLPVISEANDLGVYNSPSAFGLAYACKPNMVCSTPTRTWEFTQRRASP